MKNRKKRNKKGFNSWQIKKGWAGLSFWVHRKYGTYSPTNETKEEKNRIRNSMEEIQKNEKLK